MSGTSILVLALTGWFAIGIVLVVVLGRHGHDRSTWFLLGAMLGPLAIALAVDAWRHGEAMEPETIVATPLEHDETRVDVLVGFDQSPESRAAMASVLELFGDRLGRLLVVTVIPFDGGLGDERDARTALQREGERLAWLAPGLQLIRGEPATALVAAATEGGFDVIAVGTTGTGHAHLFGSTAGHLAHHSKVPVLLSGQSSQADHP